MHKYAQYAILYTQIIHLYHNLRFSFKNRKKRVKNRAEQPKRISFGEGELPVGGTEFAMTNVFIDGSAGTTGLRIYERLAKRTDIKLNILSEDKRKDKNERRAAINSADIVFLCLPDAAAVEAVSMLQNDKTVIIDTSTAHRTAPDWQYGFPELSNERREKIASSKRIAVPGCHASGFISLVYPLIESGVLPKSAELFCFSVTGYSGGGKKMIAEYETTDRDPLLNAPRQYGIGQTHKHLPEMTAVCGLCEAPVFSPLSPIFTAE